MPVVAAQRALDWEHTHSWTKRAEIALFALFASLAVTAAYHLGYPEFRGPQILGPLIGNGILTGAYLVTGSPLAAVLPHLAMHVAAVLHGMESTMQLPPHYG